MVIGYCRKKKLLNLQSLPATGVTISGFPVKIEGVSGGFTRAVVHFDCTGTATGKMRNDLDGRMVGPMEEHATLATDESPFQGGDSRIVA